MFGFLWGFSLDQYFREMIIWVLSIGDYPWGIFYPELSLGYFLPKDYPFRNYPLVTFLWGLSLG